MRKCCQGREFLTARLARLAARVNASLLMVQNTNKTRRIAPKGPQYVSPGQVRRSAAKEDAALGIVSGSLAPNRKGRLRIYSVDGLSDFYAFTAKITSSRAWWYASS